MRGSFAALQDDDEKQATATTRNRQRRFSTVVSHERASFEQDQATAKAPGSGQEAAG